MRGSCRRAVRAALVLCCVAAAVASNPAAAQEDALQRVQTLLASGRLTDARLALGRWSDANPPGSGGATPEQRAHALLLDGRLTADVRQAEEKYLAVVLSYPTTSHAPEALLRLGQVLVAIGLADNDPEEARRGASYLHRLVSDYPTSTHRPVGMLWLARAHQIAGDHAEACRVATEAVAAASDNPTLASLFRDERTSTCAAPPAADRAAPPAADRPVRPAPRPDEATPDEPPAGTVVRFAVQAAAVRDSNGAEALADRLRRAGFDPRVVRIEGSELHRVRVGLYVRTPEAAAVAKRLRDAGFEAVVVTDAHREIR